MSPNSLLFGLLIFFLDDGSPGASATSQIQREDGISPTLRLYNGGGIHEYVEPFDYAASKRDVEPPGSAYVRVGRSQQQQQHELTGIGSSDQDWGYGIDGEGLRASRVVRPESFIRFGRSGVKIPPHHVNKAMNDQIRGFERVVKSGGSKWVRVGRNAPTTTTTATSSSSESDLGIISPNVFLERNVRYNKDLQLCYDRLAYLCSGDSSCGGSGGSSGIINSNIANGEVNEDHLHRNNFQYFDGSE